MKNKGYVTLDDLSKFTYVSSYLQAFYIKTRFSNIFKIANAMMLSESIWELAYKFLQISWRRITLKGPLKFSKTLQFKATFNF